MSTNIVNLEDRSKSILSVDIEEKERVKFDSDIIYLRIDADFNLNKDIASFYYNLNNKEWKKIGDDFKMIFDYKKLFMGTKFAIFNYATKANGGYIDMDFFEYKKSDNKAY